MDHITHKDLDEALDRQATCIKEHISLLIKPIVKEQAEVKMILTGASKLNGLVGRIKTISTNLKVIYSLLVLVAGFLVKLFITLL